MRLRGIDVSHHQGKIDWETVKKSGIDFAIVRVGYSNRNGTGGLNYDKRYVYNLQECNRLGIPVGVYIYCYDRSDMAATKTVKELIKTITKFKIEYPVIYDIEYDNKGLSKSVNTAICNAAMKVIEDAGYYGMVYASKDFFLNHLNMADLKTTDKWEAAYRKVDDNVVINGLWQYTSKGSVPGIVGDVDLDYSYKDYATIIRKANLNGLVKMSKNSIVKTVTANRLNVRKGPDKLYDVVRIITKGTKVTVLEEKNDWSRIGEGEWVFNTFIN